MLRRFGSEQAKDPGAPEPAGAPVAVEKGSVTGVMERQETPELNALLGKGSEFDGKLAFEGTVRIDGKFGGEISTSDMLIVGESARVTAEITCGTIVVHGEINGNITASQAVELHKPARVKGDISSPSLMIERGVVFEGHTKMEDAGSGKIVPMRASGAEAD